MTEILFTVLQDILFFVLLIGGGWFFGRAFYKIYRRTRICQKSFYGHGKRNL